MSAVEKEQSLAQPSILSYLSTVSFMSSGAPQIVARRINALGKGRKKKRREQRIDWT